MKRTLPYLKPGIVLFYAFSIFLTANARGQFSDHRSITNSGEGASAGMLINFTWTGNLSTDWDDPFNWQNGLIPDENAVVNIYSGATNMPVIRNSGVCYDLNINSGASLTVQNGGSIAVYNVITPSGTFTVDGVLALQSTGTQVLPGGTYGTVSIKAGGVVDLGNDVIINTQLLLTNGLVRLGSNDLIIGNDGNISGGNSTSFIVTNGTGALKQNNIGRNGRNEEIFFPIGYSSTAYNPFWLTNHGDADAFSARVQPGIYTSYSGNNPNGGAITTHTVNRTWYIDEDVPGNSQVDLRLQWSQADENANFARGNAFIGRFENNVWDGYAAASAAGSDPYTIDRANIVSFSPFGVFDQLLLLPIKLSSFYANLQQKNVVLQWKTSSESGSNRFEVQRSVNGTDFQTIGTINAAGYSQQVNAYALTDLSPFHVTGMPTLFYRLKQVDVTGKFQYSDVLRVSESSKGNGLRVSPNPFTNLVKIQFNTPKATEVVFSVTDMNGSLVKQVRHNAEKGLNIYTWKELDVLPAGKYLLMAQIGDEVTTMPILKK